MTILHELEMLVARYRDLEARVAELRAKAEDVGGVSYDAVHVQGGVHSGVEGMAVKIVDMEQKKRSLYRRVKECVTILRLNAWRVRDEEFAVLMHTYLMSRSASEIAEILHMPVEEVILCISSGRRKMAKVRRE